MTDTCETNEHRQLRKYGMNVNVEEVICSDYSKSVIRRHDSGIQILSIGMNPRELENYKGLEIKNANEKLNNPLETTRRTELYKLEEKIEEKNHQIKTLTKINLFVKRTPTTNILVKHIKASMTAPKVNGLIGSKTLSQLKSAMKEADYVLLDWGAGVPWNYGKLKEYKNDLKDLLNKYEDKLYWFGYNNDGSPIHPASRKKKTLSKINKSNLEKIFNQ